MIERRANRLFKRLLILGFLFFLMIGPFLCSATEVWSDNFDDGNYDGWTIAYYSGMSSWSAEEKHLQIDQDNIGIIAYESTATIGTWSIDIQTCEMTGVSDPYDIVIYFMLEGMPTSEAGADWMGYAVQLSPAMVGSEFIHVFSIRKKSAEMDSATRALVLDSFDGESASSRWYHIDVTRLASGQISAFLNGTQILQAVDTDYDSSDYFALVGTKLQCFDNVVVDDQPLLSGPALEILILGSGVVAILVIVAIIAVRRR